MATTIRDWYNRIAMRVRNGINIVRNPLYYLRQQGERKLYEVIDRPLSDASRPNSIPNSEFTIPPSPVRPIPPSAFQKGGKIQGGRGHYQKTAIINPDQHWYEGQHLSSHQTVWIREYTLPEKHLSKEQITKRKEAFKHLNQLKFQTAGGQDFRIVTPVEAIAPPQSNHCYWITRAIPNSMTLEQYITSFGVMPPEQVRQVLLQVLQTLMFLHSKRWIEEWRKGIAHGNLSLDSLLITHQITHQDTSASVESPPWSKFWIHVTDLLLWKQLFDPLNQGFSVSSVAEVDALKLKDLQDLGQIGIDLLLGKRPNSDIEHHTHGYISHSRTEPDLGQRQRLTALSDKPLVHFIERLIGRGESFKTAEAAYQTLLELPVEQPEIPAVEAEPEEAVTQSRRPPLALIFVPLMIGLAGLSGWIGWRLVTPNGVADEPSTHCCISKVEIPGDRTITFMANPGESWHRALTQPGLVAENQTLIEALQARDPRLSNYQIQAELSDSQDGANSLEEAIAQLQAGEIDFVLTREQDSLPSELQQEAVAYDAVVFITAFSDVVSNSTERSPSPPQLLNGKINFDQIRALYTGEIDDWGAPRPLRDWLVSLYIPAEADAIKLFEQKILKADPRRIRRFQQLYEQGEILRSHPEVCSQPSTICSFRSIFRDYESDRTLGIGFAFLSHVYQQCSVYPLAAGEPGQTVQVLVQANGRPINPKTDLCNDKGSYFPDSKAIQAYPLRYPLVVVYPREGERLQTGKWFITMLKTDEGQHLLSKAGFVPLQKLD